MTLRAVLAAQGNLKGQGMARRPMPCPLQFSSVRQGGVRWPTCPYIPSILVWASRFVRCDLFRAAIKETRKEREGEEKLLRMRQ